MAELVPLSGTEHFRKISFFVERYLHKLDVVVGFNNTLFILIQIFILVNNQKQNIIQKNFREIDIDMQSCYIML